MKKMIGIAFAFVAVGLMPSAAAAATYDASTGYVLLQSDSPGEVTAFNAPDGNTFWEDTEAPHSGTNYFMNGKTLCTPTSPGAPLTWGGGQLVCNDKLWLVANQPITINDLVMLTGGYFYAAGMPGALQGQITVEGMAYYFYNTQSGNMEMASKMVGDASAVFRCDMRYSQMQMRFSGDLSEFDGTLIFSRSSAAKDGKGSDPIESGVTNGYVLATSVLGGKLKVEQGTKLTLESDVTVDALEIDDGVPLVMGAVVSETNVIHCLTVTGDLTLHGRPKILIDAIDQNLTAGYSRPFLRFNKSINLTPDDFEIVVGATLNTLGCYQFTWEVGESADGDFKELRAVKIRPAGDLVYLNPASASTEGYSPFHDAKDKNGKDFWSDGEIPQEGFVYAVTNSRNVSMYVTSSAEASQQQKTSYAFPGEAIYLDDATFSAASSTGHSGGFDAAALYWRNGSIMVWAGGNKDTAFNRNIDWWTFSGGALYTYAGGTIKNVSYNSQGIKFDSELVGGGTLELSTTAAGLSTGRRTYTFITRPNPAFTGRITVSAATPEPVVCSKDDLLAPSDLNCVTLFVTNGLSLGGACPAFTYDALKLESYGLLRILKRDVVLADGLNRGLFVNGIGRVTVEDAQTLTINWPVTLKGAFRKHGTGTLCLGGALYFEDGQAETAPAEGRNVVRIEEGTLALTAAHALDGASVTCSNDTQIVLKESSLTDEFATKGLVNVKGSFATNRFAVAGEGPVSVSVDAANIEASAMRAVFGLATFPTEAEATAFKNKITLAHKVTVGNTALLLMSAAPVLNGDGTYTLQATYVFKGLTISIR